MRKVLDEKPYSVVSRSPEHGRSTAEVQCPFCDLVTTCYIWSVSGGGKMCETEGCDTVIGRNTACKLAPALTEKQQVMLDDVAQFICAVPDSGWQPNKRTLNSLIRKGLVFYGVRRVDGKIRETGYQATDAGKLCAKPE